MRTSGRNNYRFYQRVLVPDHYPVQCEGVGIALDGKVSVLSLGGMYIRTRESHPEGSAFGIRMSASDDVVETVCVVRRREPGGLGVEFVKLRGQHEESLKRILARLKQ
ncbi:MAG: PilZ domain-containing protein [Candidatus Acidiferrales bacterium]